MLAVELLPRGMDIWRRYKIQLRPTPSLYTLVIEDWPSLTIKVEYPGDLPTISVTLVSAMIREVGSGGTPSAGHWTRSLTQGEVKFSGVAPGSYGCIAIAPGLGFVEGPRQELYVEKGHNQTVVFSPVSLAIVRPALELQGRDVVPLRQLSFRFKRVKEGDVLPTTVSTIYRAKGVIPWLDRPSQKMLSWGHALYSHLPLEGEAPPVIVVVGRSLAGGRFVELGRSAPVHLRPWTENGVLTPRVTLDPSLHDTWATIKVEMLSTSSGQYEVCGALVMKGAHDTWAVWPPGQIFDIALPRGTYEFSLTHSDTNPLIVHHQEAGEVLVGLRESVWVNS